MYFHLDSIFAFPDAGKKKYGVIGWPVDHSLSPAMHNAAITHLGLSAVYRAIPVPANGFGDFVGQAQDLLDGFNITVPYKEKIQDAGFPGLAVQPGTASINTMKRVPGGWAGSSTDGLGFLDDLAAAGVSAAGKKVALLGAGGSAAALLDALTAAGAADVAIINRTADNARRLAGARQAVRVPGDRAAWERSVREADLVVNTTSLGMTPAVGHVIDFAWLRAGQTVYDLVYHRETELLAAAKKAGARALDGLGMLVRQGARSFQIWFNCEPPVDVMRRAAEEELERRKNT